MTNFKYGYLTSLLYLFAHHAMCTTLHVGTNSIFKSISSAIGAAKSGDTIIIEGGIYKENEIKIDKSLYLKGLNYPVIDGVSNHGLILIKSNYVHIEGLLLENTGSSSLDDRAGVKILKSNHCIVEKNVFQNTCFGCFLSNSNHCLISNNRFSGSAITEMSSGGGVHLLHCDSCIIYENTISGHRDGIYFEFVTHSLITKNISRNNIRYGLHFMFSDNDKYVDNVFEENASGVAVMYTKHIIMNGNTFRNNWGGRHTGCILERFQRAALQAIIS